MGAGTSRFQVSPSSIPTTHTTLRRVVTPAPIVLLPAVVVMTACGVRPGGDHSGAGTGAPVATASINDHSAPEPRTAVQMPTLPEALRPRLRMDWPVEVVHITSEFGWRIDPVSGKGTRAHGGVDLRGAIGDLVVAVAPGTVIFAGHDTLLGTHVIIDHGQAIQSFYGHLSGLLVHDGLAVERGAAIGLVGNTGRSAAPHLHLTIKVQGVPVDPIDLIGHPVHAPTAMSARPTGAESEADTGSESEPLTDPQ